MNEPTNNDDMESMTDVPLEYYRNVEPNMDDILEEAEFMGYRDGKRGPTVDDSGQGLNSDEI